MRSSTPSSPGRPRAAAASSRRADCRSATDAADGTEGDPANAGIRREPELPEHEEVVGPPQSPEQEFEFLDDEPDVDAAKVRAMRQRMRMVARQVAMNPDDGIDL